MLDTFISPLQRLVSRLTARSSLGTEERDALLSLAASPSAFRAGQTVVHCGDPVEQVSLVAGGLIGSVRQTRGGKRQIVALHIPGDMADLASMAQREAGCDLKALADSLVVRVSHRDLCAVASAFPAVAAALWKDSVADARVLQEWAFNIGSKNARSRLAHLFCEMACRYEQTGCDVGLNFELSLTQDQLAETTAMTPVHLNRSLNGLRRDGIVEMRSRVVEILDWNGLVRVAEFNPRYLHFGRATIQ